jgi:hypothetical protein
LLLLCAFRAATSAELFPYSLPSQQRVAPTATSPIEQRAARPAISEAYYDKFKAEAKTLKPEQRAELRQTFAQKRDLAIKGGRLDEARHYLRLVNILDAPN